MAPSKTSSLPSTRAGTWRARVSRERVRSEMEDGAHFVVRDGHGGCGFGGLVGKLAQPSRQCPARHSSPQGSTHDWRIVRRQELISRLKFSSSCRAPSGSCRSPSSNQVFPRLSRTRLESTSSMSSTVVKNAAKALPKSLAASPAPRFASTSALPAAPSTQPPRGSPLGASQKQAKDEAWSLMMDKVERRRAQMVLSE